MDRYIKFWSNQFDQLDRVFETKYTWKGGTWGFNKVYKHYLSEKLPNKIAALVAEKYSDYKAGKTSREDAIKSLVSELAKFQKHEGNEMKQKIKLSELRMMIKEAVQRKLMMEGFDWKHDAPDNIKPYGKIIEKYFYIQDSWQSGTDVYFLMEDDAGYFVVMVNANNEKFSIGVPGAASVDGIGIMRLENSLKKFISITKQAIELGKYHSDDDSF